MSVTLNSACPLMPSAYTNNEFMLIIIS